MNKDMEMFGCDIKAFVDVIEVSVTYKLCGANMVIASLMSDAQEQMSFGDNEGARQSLNKAKYLLFLVMDNKLVGTVEREAA